MAALTNTQISVTYVGLLKTNSSTVLSGTAQQIVDGAGTASPLYLSTSSLGIGGSPTVGKELDVTGNVLITGDLQIDNINIDGNTISATSGVVTLQDGTIATTQSQGDNSTKLATTAYVDAAIGANDTLAEILANGNTTGGTDIAVSAGDDITFTDTSRALFGTGNDLQIFHESTDSYIKDVGTGNLWIQGSTQVNIGGANGQIGIQYIEGADVTLRHNNAAKLSTTSTGVSVTGRISNLTDPSAAQDAATKNYVDSQVGANNELSEVLANGNTTGGTDISVSSGDDITFADDSKVIFGASSDLQIYHNTFDGANEGLISNSTNNLKLVNTDDNSNIVLQTDDGSGGITNYLIANGFSGAVELYHYGTKKFETTTNGVEVTGTLIDLDSSANATVAIDRGATSNDAIVSWRNAGSEFFRAGLDGTDSNLWSLLHTCGTGLYFDGSNMRFGFGYHSPQFPLHVVGPTGTEVTVARFAKGNFADTGGHTTIIGLGTENAASWTKAALAFERTSSYDTGKIHFLQDNTFDTSTATLSDSVFTIDRDGQIYNSGSTSANGYNTFYGSQALFSRTTGVRNTAFGSLALDALTSGSYNTAIGWGNQSATSTGTYNTSVGYDTLTNVSTGTRNSTFGSQAGVAITTGSYNTILGFNAGSTQTDASYVTAVGDYALANNTGSSNSALGQGASQFETSGEGNTALGAAALQYQVGGNYNVAIGFGASQNSSSYNKTGTVCIGRQAGFANTGDYNVSIGYQAGYNSGSGFYNVSVGFRALHTTTSGNYNNAVGSEALLNLSTGTHNNALGFAALKNVTTGSHNIGIGYDAFQALTATSYNTGVGGSVGTFQTGNYNTSMGYFSNYGVSGSSTGTYNSTYGYYSGYGNRGTHNTFLGALAGRFNSTGSRNTFVGSQAADNSAVTGSDNVALGCRAANNITSAANNVAIGASCLEISTSGEGQVAIGFEALKDCTTGSGNIAIGKKAGENLTTGGSNTFIGYAAAGAGTVSGGANICIGDATGYNLSGGSNNILIGQNAGRTGSQTPQSLGAVTTNSNEIQMGNGSHTGAYIQIGWTTVSDARDKGQIKDVPHGLDFVSQLQPKSFEFKPNREAEETDGIERYGFLAQDVLELEGESPVVVNKNDENKLKMTNDYLVPILVNAIKELKQEIETLKSQINN